MAPEYIEHKLVDFFGIKEYCRKRQSKNLVLYGGFLSAPVIKEKGGLYNALAIVLAPHYFKAVDMIEKYLLDIEDIRILSLEDIKEENLNKIMKEFDLIAKLLQEL